MGRPTRVDCYGWSNEQASVTLSVAVCECSVYCMCLCTCLYMCY